MSQPLDRYFVEKIHLYANKHSGSVRIKEHYSMGTN